MLKSIALAVCIATTSAACATSGTEATATNPAKTDAGQTYYWYDGKKKRAIQMAPDFVADFQQKSVLQPAGSQKSLSSKQSPVFVAASGGNKMRALPGGVIVRFSQAVTEGQANDKLAGYNASVSRPIGSSGKTWLVQTEAGMPALELANRIFEGGGVESAAPNWWQERTLK